MSILSSIGHAIGGGLQKVAPVVGMVPGIGTLAASGLGALGGALAPGGGLKGALMGGAEGAAGGLINKIPGVSDMLGKVGSTLGSSLGDTFMPNGKLDLGKIISAAGAGMNLYGANKQRNSAENYANSQIDQRNQLMNTIMGPGGNAVGLPDISNQINQAKAPVNGPKITPMNPNAQASAKLSGQNAQTIPLGA